MIPPDGLHPWYVEIAEFAVKNAAELVMLFGAFFVKILGRLRA